MKAVQISAPGGNFELVQRPIPEPGEDEVLIKVEACGVCHGDAIVKEGHFPGIQYPRIPGHEVIGTIDKAGTRVKNWQPGQRVGVGWHGGHCFTCGACRGGDFGGCEQSLITGISTDGGYAEYMVARAEALVAIPDELSPVEGAPLLCAGRTTFGALKSCIAKGGDLVAIHGLGGLGHLAVQYAAKLGFKTVALSRGKAKEALAYQLGVHIYIDAGAVDAAQELRKLGGAKVILSTAPDSKAISGLISGLARHGQLIFVSAPAEPIPVSPLGLLRNGLSLTGFSSGNIEEAIRFSVVTKALPVVDVFPLEQAAEAYQKMITAKVHFRSVLKMGN
ncbi:alcohol dehydrogenase [Lucifera butyrica]|nr:alcohol dehydrogenase [Lucifera butyrica]